MINLVQGKKQIGFFWNYSSHHQGWRKHRDIGKAVKKICTQVLFLMGDPAACSPGEFREILTLWSIISWLVSPRALHPPALPALIMYSNLGTVPSQVSLVFMRQIEQSALLKDTMQCLDQGLDQRLLISSQIWLLLLYCWRISIGKTSPFFNNIVKFDFRKKMLYTKILINLEHLVFTGISNFSLDALSSQSLSQNNKASVWYFPNRRYSRLMCVCVCSAQRQVHP